jgi:hypothetical protein
MTPPQRAGSLAFVVISCLTALAVVACGSPAPTSRAPVPAIHEATDANTGAAATAEGYTFDSPMAVLGGDQAYRFRILGPDGLPQKSYAQDRPDPVQVYAVRDDLGSYLHLRPAMSPDGTWSLRLPLRVPGPYHVYASAALLDASQGLHELVLSRPLTLPGAYQLWPRLPDASTTAETDGYAVSFADVPRPWDVTSLDVRFSTHAGQPVADLEPLAGAYAHVAAIRMPGHLFAHAAPLDRATPGRAGGPDLKFDVEFPGAGDYRVFVEFQTGGKLHTAALTMRVV